VLPAVLGLAPAREEIFETIWELSAAIGILGVGCDDGVAGGVFDGANGFVGGRGGFVDVEESFGGGVVCVAFDGVGGDDLGKIVLGEGFEDFVGSSGAGTGFAESSRTLLNILDASGVTEAFGGGFAGAGAGVCDASFVGVGFRGGWALEGVF
jgi:hypothetical protein